MTSNKNHLVEKKVSSKKLHQGKSFSFYQDTVTLPDGREAKRDYVKYPEAAVILPFIDNENIILIEQFRYPIGKTILELPAGKIDDPNELAEKAAARELLEETGYRTANTKFLFSFYPAIGYSTEIIHAFVATDLTEETQAPDDDEFISVKIVKYKTALEWALSGKLQDSKTILALLYYDNIKFKD